MKDFRAIEMRPCFSTCFFFIWTGCALASSGNFEIHPNEPKDVIILSQIVSNYIRRYLSHETHFISLVHVSTNGKLIHFHGEFTTNLFHNPNLTDFLYNTGDALISHRRLLQSFNIILIDDTNLLRQVLILDILIYSANSSLFFFIFLHYFH